MRRSFDVRYNAPIDHLLSHCGHLQLQERTAIVFDSRTADVADQFHDRARSMSKHVTIMEVPAVAMHGIEPPGETAAAMLEQDLIVGLTFTSMAHTRARHDACSQGARYLSLPEYSWRVLSDPSVMTDFRERAPVVRRIADAFTAGQRVRVTTGAGTDILLDIRGRTGNYCPGFVDLPGTLGSPPDIEANVPPIETASHGVIVVDGSIPCKELGLLSEPVTLHVENGRVTRFVGPDPDVVRKLDRIFAAVGTANAYVLAECGLGLNTAATLTGAMLTDEGANGCVHFGIGSNSTVGGRNEVGFHLDFVCRDATLAIDDEVLVSNGTIV